MVVRTYEQECAFVKQVDGCSYSIGQGFVDSMRVPGHFYVNEEIKSLLFDELKWPAVVTCAFVVCYSLFDTLGVGRARARCKHFDATAELMSPAKPVPEELALALRAHANQVEQFSVGNRGQAHGGE